jgi:hypothetical protein
MKEPELKKTETKLDKSFTKGVPTKSSSFYQKKTTMRQEKQEKVN